MTGTIEQMLARGAETGLQVTIWPTMGGEYQANVKERAGSGWTCVTSDDPLDALRQALHQRLTGFVYRETVRLDEPVQIDIEDAIAKVDEFSELLG